ncbi:hypothetical protein ACFQLX_02385 [Streptomyces polyrhachis]|uniref:Integral membrane protein n=1 Tax=Streptomyces polyrhachis TaxID=1282885 RepID=A0ABW2GAK3_9ACTN
MTGVVDRDGSGRRGGEAGAAAARGRALAVLRVRHLALALALLPLAVAAVLLIGSASGRIDGPLAAARWWVLGLGLAVLALAALVAVAVLRAEPARSPTVPVPREGAADLYRLVGELAERLGVPAPSAIALTPDCDSWLEDRAGSHLRSGRALLRGREAQEFEAPVLVIGSPFLWWMRVAELRALLAPVVAGTGPAAQPDIAAARRFIRGLDAAAADAPPASGRFPSPGRFVVRTAARIMLRSCGEHPAEMERGVAAAGSERAQTVDYGLRIAAQEQVGLAYAGWDRLLTRVALPAWHMGRWPSRLDAGVVSALTELSRRDRLAAQDGAFAVRLGERPACDLLEEPGLVDEAVSLLAAQLFHGTPAPADPPAPSSGAVPAGGDASWSPVGWEQYPDEVVDRTWRTEATRLHAALDALTEVGAPPGAPPASDRATLARVVDWLTSGGDRGALAEALRAAVEAETAAVAVPPLLQLQAPRTGRELLAGHVLATVCCAAVDTAGALPGLDWLDGPVLLVGGERRPELGRAVQALVELGDALPLRHWLGAAGVRAEKPLLLV